MMDIHIDEDELDLLIEALTSRASRLDSMARASSNVRVGNSHDEVAREMRKLRARLLKARGAEQCLAE